MNHEGTPKPAKLGTFTPAVTRRDLIAGIFRSGGSPRVVYSMEVDEVLDWESYYHDRRFQSKKPPRNGGWKALTGDNIYFLGPNGTLQQDKNAAHHTDKKNQTQDIRGNKVFIGRRFIYFGENATALPKEFVRYLPGRGIMYLKEEFAYHGFREFLRWRMHFGFGIRGLPRDRDVGVRDSGSACTCTRIGDGR